MNKVFKYASAYGMWIVDLGLALWLVYLSRTAILGILALFYEPGDLQYLHAVNFTDKVIAIILGLGWLAFTIIIEDYYRKGALKGDMLKRFARVTGPIFLCSFVIDLILFWLQGIGSDNWLRWLILAAELGIGIALIIFVKNKSTHKPI